MRDKFDAPVLTRGFYWSVLGVSLLVAGLKRLEMIAPPGFPLGEGGLFVLFSQTILNNDFSLPERIVYGGVTIPFAYPPAGFYLAAIVAKAVGSDLLTVYYLAPDPSQHAGGGCLLLLQPSSQGSSGVPVCIDPLRPAARQLRLQIMGGGLPRSLATIFAPLAVGLALRVAKTSSEGVAALRTCVGLSILSRLEWGRFSAGGGALAFLTRAGGWKRAILLTAAVGTMALVVISPWIAAILSRHGVDPFLSSSSASNWNAGDFIASSLSGRLFGLLVWPAILGTFVTISRRNWFLISWTLLPYCSRRAWESPLDLQSRLRS